MFGIILAIVAAGTFGVMAINSAVRSTGSKVEQGDTVTIPVQAIGLVDAGSAPDIASLGVFLHGFIQSNVRVTNVIPTGPTAIGSIVGLAPPVKFALSSVLTITRDGQTFT